MEIHINRFGVILKGHQTAKWRFIVDMSHTEGHSVNDGIDPALCSLSYTTVEMAAQRVLSLGKLDLKSAYQMVPVHPDDRDLLGIKWRGKVWLTWHYPLVSGLLQKCSMCWQVAYSGYFSTMV